MNVPMYFPGLENVENSASSVQEHTWKIQNSNIHDYIITNINNQRMHAKVDMPPTST